MGLRDFAENTYEADAMRSTERDADSDDPYSPAGKTDRIVVMRSIRSDVGSMHARHQIDQMTTRTVCTEWRGLSCGTFSRPDLAHGGRLESH